MNDLKKEFEKETFKANKDQYFPAMSNAAAFLTTALRKKKRP